MQIKESGGSWSNIKKIECEKKSQDFFLDLFKREVHCKSFGYVAVFMDESNQIGRFRTNLVFEDGTPYETVHFK